MDAGLVDPSLLASDLVVSVGLEGHDQRGVIRELRMSVTCIYSDRAGSSGVKLSKEPKGFDPEGGDEGVEINLDDELESLLDFLNAWRKVAASSFWVIPGLSRHMKLELLDLLTSQLDQELISRK